MKERSRGFAERVFLGTLAVAVFISAHIADAETLEELKHSIEAKNEEIRRLEEEAQKFRQEISVRQEQSKTLSGELTQIDRTIARVRRQIALTEQRINKKELEVQALALEIREKGIAVENLQVGLGAVLRAVSERDQESLLAVLIKYRRLSDFLRQIDDFAVLEDKMLGSIERLRELRSELEEKKLLAEENKEELKDLRSDLSGRRAVQEGEKRRRSELLSGTRSQEKQYQELLYQREKRRIALEEEIRGIEEKIRITIDSSLLPSKGGGVLGRPLPSLILGGCRTSNKKDPDTNCITQHFGYTSFAAVGGYNGSGHNGVDFRAEVGTPVLAADNGVVSAVGDTDAYCRRASYGRWILVSHPNNLTTLYAHLSAIGISAGQQIKVGERIGYSGMSGYATGPHLHFSVFATQAVRVENIRSRICGTTMAVPIAAINGYLNPLDYL